MRAVGATVNRRLDVIHAVSAQLTPQQVTRLSSIPGIRIYGDRAGNGNAAAQGAPGQASLAALKPFGICLEEVRAFIAHPGTHFERFNALAAELDARGLKGFYQLDPTIVRGLAYYTGLVFEVFDRKKTLRAVAGGGRYDNLMNAMSDGKVTLPAIGFGMGDVVLGELIDATPAAAEKMRAWIAQRHAADVYVIIANETRRVDALGLVQQLRGLGFRVDYPLSAAKVGKQFQAAEQAGARCALVIGDEWPQLKMKILATREELLVNLDELPVRLAS